MDTRGEEREQGIENLFEKVMREKFPNLAREKVTQVQKAERVPIKKKPKRLTPRHTIKWQILKTSYLNGNKGETASNIQSNSNKAIS